MVVEVVPASSPLPFAVNLPGDGAHGRHPAHHPNQDTSSSNENNDDDAPIRYRSTLVVRPMQGETVIKLASDGGACRFDVDTSESPFKATQRGFCLRVVSRRLCRDVRV